MSVFSAAERLAALDRSKVVFDGNRCLHARDKFSKCMACFDVCPAGAITPGNPPVLRTETCRNCLACLPACPAGAYTAEDAVPALLNCAGRLENHAIELVCSKHLAAEQGFQEDVTGVRVRGCLAGLGAGTYMILSAMGFEKVIARIDACRVCEWGRLQSVVESQVSQAQRFLAAWDRSQSLRCLAELETSYDRSLWEADNPPLSRRDLFHLVARQGQVAIGRAIESGHAAGEHRPGRERLRILGAMAHLPDFVKGNEASLAGMGFAHLSVSEACTACGVCGRACPTGALLFEKGEDGKTYTLNFSARKCIGCEICVQVCVSNAVSINLAPTFASVFDVEMLPLQAGELGRCERCNSLIAARPGIKLCPVCEFRRAHPFGSSLPPGVKPGRLVHPEEKTS